MRTVQIFDRPCCGPSAASKLAEFLQERADDRATVEYHNLNDSGTTAVQVPGAVIAHLTSRGPLPVLSIDGQIVAAGTMPNLMDAVDLLNGSAAPRPTATLQMAAAADNGACCS